jgi:hypothetical protein
VPVGTGVALLTTVSVLVYNWAAVGLKVTLRLQAPPRRTGVVQVPRATVNGPGATLAEVMTSGLVPVFLTRTLLVTLAPIRIPLPPPKVVLAMVAVVAVVTGSGGWAVPVPLTVTLEGDPSALCAIETVAVLGTAEVGENCTVTVQLPRGATVPQLLLANENCDASAPVIVTPDTTRLPFPVLLTVMACGAEVVPTA